MQPNEKFVISEFRYHKHTMEGVKPPAKSTTKKKQFKLKQRRCQSVKDNFIQYLKESTLHGLKYVGNPNISMLERIFFAVSVTIVYCISVNYINEIYVKWSNQPIIMSVSPTPTQITDIPFAAFTICNVNQAQKHKADKIRPDSIENYYLNYICKFERVLTINITDGNWQEYKPYIMELGESCDGMLYQCVFGGIVFNCSELFVTILTDAGLCCTFNSVHPQYMVKLLNDYNFMGKKSEIPGSQPVDWTPENGYPEYVDPNSNYYPRKSPGSGISLGLKVFLNAHKAEYFCSNTFTEGFKAILHTPTEVPKVKEYGFYIPIGKATQVAIRTSYITSNADLRSIPIRKRECYFDGEMKLEYFRTYSRIKCQRECESKFVEKECGCVNYWMPRIRPDTQICNSEEYTCAVNASNNESRSSHKRNCNCYPSCSEYSYASSVTTSNMWFHPRLLSYLNLSAEFIDENIAMVDIFYESNFVNPIIRDPYMRISDVLSQTGGILGLFLGFSVISLVEILYFLTLRPMTSYFRERRDNILFVNKLRK